MALKCVASYVFVIVVLLLVDKEMEEEVEKPVELVTRSAIVVSTVFFWSPV